MSEYIFIALLVILVIILVILAILFVKTKANTEISAPQTLPPKKELTQKEIKAGVIDIFELLKLQSEILFDECARFDNMIFIDYPKKLPRIYDNSATMVLQTLNYICKFFAFEFNKANIKIDFNSLRMSDNKILLNITVNSDKHLTQPRILAIKNFLEDKQQFDDINLTKAKENAEKIGSFLRFDTEDDKISINFSSNLVFYKSSRFGFMKNRYNYNVLICENSAAVFDDLTLLFAQMGCAVAPNSTWANIKKHLDDFIYKPDIVLISTEVLHSQKEIEYLNSVQKNKNAFFAFILRNKSDLKLLKRVNFSAFKIKMPYLYDDIYALCEIVQKAKQTGSLDDFN